MKYLAFILKDPDTKIVHCVGVKYKQVEFSDCDIQKIKKNGTANRDVKDWIKSLKEENKVPDLEILYQGEDSATACWHKQQYIINHNQHNLIGINISTKRYTKKYRINEEMRTPIIDQFGEKYPGVLEAAEKLFLAPSNISKVLHGKLNHIGGYQFKFDF